eukprot:13357729-Alexandrium_andersonii.AAC.1
MRAAWACAMPGRHVEHRRTCSGRTDIHARSCAACRRAAAAQHALILGRRQRCNNNGAQHI